MKYTYLTNFLWLKMMAIIPNVIMYISQKKGGSPGKALTISPAEYSV